MALLNSQRLDVIHAIIVVSFPIQYNNIITRLIFLHPEHVTQRVVSTIFTLKYSSYNNPYFLVYKCTFFFSYSYKIRQ